MFSPKAVLDQVKIPAGSAVADFGCGTGAFVKALSGIVGPGGKIYAVDVQQNLLSRLAAECEELGIKNMETMWGDVEAVGGSKLRDGILDYVVLSNILFQVESRQGLVAEAKRVLKPGGRAILVDWKESFNNLGPHQKDVISESQAEQLFIAAGFISEKRLTVGGFHYGILFKKG